MMLWMVLLLLPRPAHPGPVAPPLDLPLHSPFADSRGGVGGTSTHPGGGGFRPPPRRSERERAASSPPPDSTLNARSFGAVGDGRQDDWAPLQKAITTAQEQQRALFVPAGVYLVSKPLNVSLAVVTDPGKRTRGAFRLFGEGMYLTVLQAGGGISSILFFEAAVDATNPHPFYGSEPTCNHLVAELTLNGTHKATHGVLAPGITRSRFSAVSPPAPRPHLAAIPSPSCGSGKLRRVH